MDDREGERHRHERQVAAPQVQQPGNARRVSQHATILRRRTQHLTDGLAFLRRGLAGKRQRLRHGWSHGRVRPAFPNRVDRVRRNRHHLDAGSLVSGEPLGAHQPRVVSQLLGAVRNPFRRRLLGDVEELECVRVGLLGQLQHIAAIGEHRRLVLQHDCDPGAAGEPAQPTQPLGARRDVLTQVLVRTGNDESRHANSLESRPQRRNPGLCHIFLTYL